MSDGVLCSPLQPGRLDPLEIEANGLARRLESALPGNDGTKGKETTGKRASW